MHYTSTQPFNSEALGILSPLHGFVFSAPSPNQVKPLIALAADDDSDEDEDDADDDDFDDDFDEDE
ncbi:MAG: hypothetical protein IT240_07160, partial [Bacteroidia bacterium]|nr:hypothetical protein [Bacteroidia bacterium]